MPRSLGPLISRYSHATPPLKATTGAGIGITTTVTTRARQQNTFGQYIGHGVASHHPPCGWSVISIGWSFNGYHAPCRHALRTPRLRLHCTPLNVVKNGDVAAEWNEKADVCWRRRGVSIGWLILLLLMLAVIWHRATYITWRLAIWRNENEWR